MTLTMQQIWERYSEIDFVRTIEVNRLNADGSTYEGVWTNIEDLVGSKVNVLDVCQDIKLEIPNDTYATGVATMDNASLLFENQFGQLSDESNGKSIFSGFIRHKSQVRVIDGYMDKYTDPNNPELVTAETFKGLIDDRQCETSFDDQEKIIVTGTLQTLLKQFIKSDFGLSGTDSINDWIFTIFNRAPFTDFFTISAGNISAGLNIGTFDMDQYDVDANMLDIVQDLAKGHSIMYIKNGVFYFVPYVATAAVQIDLSTSPERKIKFKNYNSGAKRVKDKWFWDTTNLSYIAANPIYNEIETVDIKGITQNAERQDWLNFVGANSSTRKPLFELNIPFLPILFLLDRISMTREGAISPDSFLLDVSMLDEGRLIDPSGAIIINSGENWIVRGVKHTKKLETVLILEKIIV